MTEKTAVPMLNPLQRWFRNVVVVAWVLGSVAMVLGICSLLTTGNHAAGRDIISFWVAGRRIAARANPYDDVAVLSMEHAAGFSATAQALIMRNPPYALPLVLPLSPFQLEAASRLWSLLLIAAFALSVHLLWIAYGRPANKMHLFAYTFGPAVTCIMGGQTAIFALLGLALFLRLQREHPFAAGMSLWFCALKPHLFFPFAVVVLLWALVSRRYRLIASAAFSLAAASALATWLDPAVWTQYRQMMQSPNIQAEFIPCLSYVLRTLHPRTAWLQYVPSAAGCCWAAWFYLSRRRRWNWIEDGALLVLVSLVVSPYAWVTDHAILVPALLVGMYRATSQAQLGVLALASVLIEVAQFTGISMHSAIFSLVPLFWLGWYLYVAWQGRPRARMDDSAQDTAFIDAPVLHSL